MEHVLCLNFLKSSGAIAPNSALLIPPALIYMTTLHRARAVPKMHPTIERLLAKKKLARTNPKPCSRISQGTYILSEIRYCQITDVHTPTTPFNIPTWLNRIFAEP